MFAAYMCVYMGTFKQVCVYASVCVYMSLVYLYICKSNCNDVVHAMW